MKTTPSFKERKPIRHLQVIWSFLIFVNIALNWWKVLITKQNDGRFKEMIRFRRSHVFRTQQTRPPQFLIYFEFILFHENQEHWPVINCIFFFSKLGFTEVLCFAFSWVFPEFLLFSSSFVVFKFFLFEFRWKKYKFFPD